MKNGGGRRYIIEIFNTAAVCVCVNGYMLQRQNPGLIPLLLALFLFVNIGASLSRKYYPSRRVRLCGHGVGCLKMFAVSAIVSVLYHVWLIFRLAPDERILWVWSAAVCIMAEAVIFWNGMISVYLSSVQLGIHHRWVGLLCGMIPVANLFLLARIIKIVGGEVDFETEKALLNESRKERKICRTKYPILMVHGVFFRDFRYLNYWGRIPEELKKNGGVIYYGEHQSAASVEESGREIAERIKNIAEKTGYGKVNIIAHSKGGLDCRCAAARFGAEKYIASITTINTPHHGCEFVDYLLSKIPEGAVSRIASAYNGALKRLGDESPDFISAVKDLTTFRCERLNNEMPLPEGIFCQSVGSGLSRASGGKFPLNYTYHLVKYFDGPNDGLVSENSMRWGENSVFLTAKGKRGISHGDMIDLNRENIPGFDVREFYVSLVSDLRERGL